MTTPEKPAGCATVKLPEQFLRAIAENPADDLPRIVVADWLDEQGDSQRAEFVRLQIAVEELESCKNCSWLRTAGPFPTYRCRGKLCRLRRRAGKILQHRQNEWDAEWLGEINQYNYIADGMFLQTNLYPEITYHWWRYITRDITYRRGFPASMKIPLAAWLEWGPKLVRELPLESVRMTDREPILFDNGKHGWVPQERDTAWSIPVAAMPITIILQRLAGRPSRLTLSPVAVMNHSLSGNAFATPELAHSALSTAALEWARSQFTPEILTTGSAGAGRVRA